MESFAIPGVGGIIEKNIAGTDYILIQERCKTDAPAESGLIEIPAGKIRKYENIFDCLRREIWEETDLEVTEIYGEAEAKLIQSQGYKVLSYKPFSCAQNIEGHYPILVQIFICKVKEDIPAKATNESRNMRWISLEDLRRKLEFQRESFYPMHITTLEKYLAYKTDI